jgi:hypothetical protein
MSVDCPQPVPLDCWIVCSARMYAWYISIFFLATSDRIRATVLKHVKRHRVKLYIHVC